MTKPLLTFLLTASMATCRSTLAQQPAAPLPVYDVVVIKPNNTLVHSTSVDVEDTTFRARNVSLRFLLVIAYGIREGQISGLPSWADSLHFDLEAKVTDADVKVLHSLTREQQQAMLIAVLADRFHLQSHTELKTLPVYDLVIAKDGPKLKPTVVPPDPTNPDNPSLGDFSVHNTDMTAKNVSMSDLAEHLAAPVDRTVIDKTGLKGRYDFELKWTSENAAMVAGDNGAADAPPNLFTALQEQLGLKLQSAKGQSKVLVIDHVDQPSAN